MRLSALPCLACLPSCSRCHPHHGLRTAATDTTEDAATSGRPFPSRCGDGRQAEAEAPVEASRAGESRLTSHATPPVSSMPSSKAKFSYSIKRGANPVGGGGGRNMSTNRDYSVNLSVQQVLSLWVQGTTLQHFTGMRNERCFHVLSCPYIQGINQPVPVTLTRVVTVIN